MRGWAAEAKKCLKKTLSKRKMIQILTTDFFARACDLRSKGSHFSSAVTFKVHGFDFLARGCDLRSKILKSHWDHDTPLIVHTPDGQAREGTVSGVPF